MHEGITQTDLRNYAEIWCEKWKVPVGGDEYGWKKAAEWATLTISGTWGGIAPSPFKRAAAAAMAIVVLGPIDSHLPVNLRDALKVSDRMAKHPNILRAIIGHHFACWVLQNSKIGDCQPDQSISTPISISAHFFNDLLWILANTEIEKPHLCGPLSMIYEACVYQTNPQAQDDQ